MQESDPAPQSGDPAQQHSDNSVHEEPTRTITKSSETRQDATGPASQTKNADDSVPPMQSAPGWFKRSWMWIINPHHSNALVAIFTVLLFLTTVSYTVFACLQWRTMQDTLQTMKESGATTTDQTWQAIGNMNWLARTTDGSLKFSKDQFRQDQRPYLYISNGKSGVPNIVKLLEKERAGFSQATWDVGIYNFGKTPAYRVGRKFFIQVGNKHPMSRSYGEGNNNPPTLIAPTGEATIKVLSSGDIVQAEIDDILKPHSGQTITIRGTVTYADSYGTGYESGICLSRLDSGVIQYCQGNYIK